MKKIVISFVAVLLSSFWAKSQNLDSLLSLPQTLELSISTPQPRLGEKFNISIDINYVRAHIFKSAIGKFKLADGVGDNDRDKMQLNVLALKKGKTEIGPLNFTMNGTPYTTNKITYEVVDALPEVERGLWIRKVDTGDSSFAIIFEQRIPAHEKKVINSPNSFSLITEPESEKVAKFKDSYSIGGLSGLDSRGYSDYGIIYDNNNKPHHFLFSYYIYYFRILDRTNKIKITKDKLENLPADYVFNDIVVQ